MAIKNGRYIEQYVIEIKNITPLNIAGDNGQPLVDDETGEALIPGTSIAGTLRAYIGDKFGKDKSKKLFGDDEPLSKIFIYDSYSKVKGIEFRPALKINKQLGSSIDKSKFDRYILGEGHTFKLRAELYGSSKEELEEYKQYFETAVSAVDRGDVMLGSYKNIGMGVMKVERIKSRYFDLNSKVGFLNYIEKVNGEEDYRDVSLKLVDNKNIKDDEYVIFELEGKIETPLLICGYSSLDSTRPDNEQMINCYNELIIPGSSIKGVIRSECEKILSYFNKENILEEIFGDECKDKKCVSNIIIFDSKIKDSKHKVYNKIKIDKFTGGVRDGALAKDDPVIGNIKIVAKFKKTLKEEVDDTIIAAMATIFRDISIGKIPLGGGNSVGRGRISGESLKIYSNNSILYKENYKNKLISVDDMNKYFKRLNYGGEI